MLQESHSPSKIVVRLKSEERGLGSDENEVTLLFGVPMAFMWKPVRSWLLALREKGSAVGFGRNTDVYIKFLKYSCKQSFI